MHERRSFFGDFLLYFLDGFTTSVARRIRVYPTDITLTSPMSDVASSALLGFNGTSSDHTHIGRLLNTNFIGKISWPPQQLPLYFLAECRPVLGLTRTSSLLVDGNSGP